MEITGLVKWVYPVRTGISKNGNQYQSIEAMIEETGVQYPQSVVVTQMITKTDIRTTVSLLCQCAKALEHSQVTRHIELCRRVKIQIKKLNKKIPCTLKR